MPHISGLSAGVLLNKIAIFSRKIPILRRKTAILQRSLVSQSHHDAPHIGSFLGHIDRRGSRTCRRGLGDLPDSFVEDDISTVDVNGFDAEGNCFEIT